MEIDRRQLIASLGGAAVVAAMDHEARAEALEDYMSELLETPADDTPVFVQKPHPRTKKTHRFIIPVPDGEIRRTSNSTFFSSNPLVPP